MKPLEETTKKRTLWRNLPQSSYVKKIGRSILSAILLESTIVLLHTGHFGFRLDILSLDNQMKQDLPEHSHTFSCSL